MANVFYAWEFGANLGHIGRFLPLARELRRRNHALHCVVSQPQQAARMLPQEGFDWLQAPVIPERRREGPPLNYADILIRYGYGSPIDLLGLVVAWRGLLRLTQAMVVLADHAPTAILAARTLGIPVMLFGSGFFSPPLMHPTPNMRPWQKVPPAHLIEIDRLALSSINSVLEQFGQARLNHVAELFQVEEQALLTYPELDHYENRGPAKYWGMLQAGAVASVPHWPNKGNRKVFAYLRPNSAHFEVALRTLQELDSCSLVFAPGIPSQVRQRFSSLSLSFSEDPVDLKLAAQEADAALTYASPAVTTAFLLAGKPVLMVPGHLEQFLFARRIEQMGAGLGLSPEQPATDLPAMLGRILNDASFAGNAQAFARKYAAFPQEVVVANLVRRIEEICTP